MSRRSNRGGVARNVFAKGLRWVHIGLLTAAARVWRRLLPRTTFIAITGSVGKTTAKECLATVLASGHRTAKTRHNRNHLHGVPRTVLSVRPWHRFAVVEVGTDRPGIIERSARLLRPDIAVVLSVAATHTDAFATLDDTAVEKSKLLASLSPRGLAILNADDPLVHAMAGACRARVLAFGRSADANLRIDELSSRWPARLRFRATTAEASCRVDTALVGEHWSGPAAAALQAALACGFSLETAAAALSRVEPFPARMQPVRLPRGAWLLRDEENGSADAYRVALEWLTAAEATRRVVVMSDVSDTGRKTRARLKSMGRAVSRVADLAVFVGDHGRHAAKAAVGAGMDRTRVVWIAGLPEAAHYLGSELREGDLALLKGRTTDHLSRLVFAQFGPVACWKRTCRRLIVCDHCPELGAAVELPRGTVD